MARLYGWGLLACLAFPAHAGPPAETAEQILGSEPNETDYSRAKQCLPENSIDRVVVLSSRQIVFETGRTERWLAQMKLPCPGLQPGSKVAFEKRDARLCEWDSMRVMYDQGFGSSMLGPSCRMPKFEPVTQDQVDALREAIKVQRKAQRNAAPR